MMMRAFLILAVLVTASTGWALVSQENPANDPESEFHQLQWRPIPTDLWYNAGSPQPISDVTHSDVTGPFRGVDWDLTGTVIDFGEWRAVAVRYDMESVPSNEINFGLPEPPSPPLMLAALGTLLLLAAARKGHL